MKWNRPEPSRPYVVSDCKRYAINWKPDKSQYMAVRLGKEKRTARGDVWWDGSVILGVVDTADGAKELCRRDRDALPVRV